MVVSMQPFLLINAGSGGGKKQDSIAAVATELDLDHHIVEPGDDFDTVLSKALAHGANLLAAAGGDGTLCAVANVAMDHDLPMIVVPAGTRNHFALDLGLDREDVPGALDAFSDGVDIVIDLAEVNGRPFVNNASMGVYAQVVQSPEYRDAKMRTAATMLPDIIGPDAVPLDLRFPLPSGEQATTAQLLLVSNNPYQLAHIRGGGLRERLDSALLGVASVRIQNAADAQRFAALEVAGQVQRFPGWHEWTTTELTVDSDGPIEIGVDGEALSLEPPLQFSVRPGALTVRLPRHSVTAAPAGQPVRLGSRETFMALWRTALGRA
jgi:diacylglycerol kinase family enzyme